MRPIGPVVIDIENITKDYVMGEETVHALRGVSLQIHKNEYIAIMGPSGSGKSTLMNMLGCLDTPTSGRYEFNGEECGRNERRRAGGDSKSRDRLCLSDIQSAAEIDSVAQCRVAADLRRHRSGNARATRDAGAAQMSDWAIGFITSLTNCRAVNGNVSPLRARS